MNNSIDSVKKQPSQQIQLSKPVVRAAMQQIKKTGANLFLNTKNDLSEIFSGESLMVAECYRKNLINKVQNYGGIVCGLTLHNARSATFSQLTRPVVKDPKNPCPRCSGTGSMPFRHVKGGVCFRCNGTGSSK